MTHYGLAKIVLQYKSLHHSEYSCTLASILRSRLDIAICADRCSAPNQRRARGLLFGWSNSGIYAGWTTLQPIVVTGSLQLPILSDS